MINILKAMNVYLLRGKDQKKLAYRLLSGIFPIWRFSHGKIHRKRYKTFLIGERNDIIKIIWIIITIMSKTLEEKRLIVNTIADKIVSCKTCVFVQQNQIIGSESVEIRKILKKYSVEVFCIKNSLLERVLKEKNQIIDGLSGSILMITGDSDLEILNAVKNIAKDIIGLDILFSIVDQAVISKEITKQLCRYSNTKQLTAAAVSSMTMPFFQFKSLLEKIKEKKESSSD